MARITSRDPNRLSAAAAIGFGTRPHPSIGRRTCDLLVVGGGACGLWLGYKAAVAGLDVVVADCAEPGAGASGGPLGALMPHMPDRWNAKKQFQFDALISLPHEIARLEEETGVSCGYRRIGRLIPLAEPHQCRIAEDRAAAAKRNWATGNGEFDWRIINDPTNPGWPDVAGMPAGAVHETLSARLHPRRLVAALAAGIERRTGSTLARGARVVEITGNGSRCRLQNGDVLSCGSVAIAAGVGSFPLLAGLLGAAPRELGRPVKGQAALLVARRPPGDPIVFRDGVYVVPHDNGTVAVGSTSEETFDDPLSTDRRLDRIVERVRALCPALESAPVLERWSGLRPRAAGRDPMIGALPDHPRIFALTGGFKITLGIAHRLADAVLADIGGPSANPVPESFRVEAHLRAARR